MPGFIEPSKLINDSLLEKMENEISKTSSYDLRIEELLEYFKARFKRGRIIMHTCS